MSFDHNNPYCGIRTTILGKKAIKLEFATNLECTADRWFLERKKVNFVSLCVMIERESHGRWKKTTHLDELSIVRIQS